MARCLGLSGDDPGADGLRITRADRLCVTGAGRLRVAVRIAVSVGCDVIHGIEAPRLLVVRGCAPRWQFCHVDDLASALELAAVGVVRGDLTVGCDGSLSQAEVESLSGLKSLELPARLTFSTAQRLHRLGVIPSPSAELPYVVYPWAVECAALHAAGWRSAFSNAEALSVLLAARAGHHAVLGRRIARKDAAITGGGCRDRGGGGGGRGNRQARQKEGQIVRTSTSSEPITMPRPARPARLPGQIGSDWSTPR